MTRPVMIFHVPFPLNPEATSASGIRPVKLRRAFESNGYEVLEVSGRHPERRARMRELKRRIRDGLQVDFVYSEASTTPTGLGEKITTATSLTRDIRFLRFCRRAGIPVGLFYRDIYWQFDEYAERVGQPYTSVLRWRYRADLRGYRTAVDKIYLPSMRMAEYLPEANQPQAAPLPPGSDSVDAPSPDPATGISLFYVGGTGGYYRMQETVRGVEAARNGRLTICTREGEWQESAPLYAEVLGDSTTVVHRSGAELEALYADAHLGVLLMEPLEYREFAAPMKLYEYLGHGKPIIATEGSLAGDFVETHGIGWALPYDADALQALLERLAADPQLLEDKVRRAREVRDEHTWEARARAVALELTP
ncbi:glycosyltransferase [Leucobacter sp. GX24907]